MASDSEPVAESRCPEIDKLPELPASIGNRKSQIANAAAFARLCRALARGRCRRPVMALIDERCNAGFGSKGYKSLATE
jgi:hypothetical protein